MIKILLDTPISKSCNAISSKASRIISIIRNSHTIMQILACFTITTSNAGTKINCRRNGNEVKFESRRNGSRRNGSRQNGSRRNGSRRNGNTPVSRWDMEFNPSKCQVMRVTTSRKAVNFSYTLHGHVLGVVSSAPVSPVLGTWRLIDPVACRGTHT